MQTNKVNVLSNNDQVLLKKNFFDYSSRYNRSKLILYSDLNLLTLETYDRRLNIQTPLKFKNFSPSDIKFYQITKGTQYKPWLASQDVYGDPGYWWVLMEYNNIFDVEDFTFGKTIEVVPLSSISGGA